ncbi:hypothetical protein NQ176_g2761 [Zarea fungicola]|uniref:Uncharacterized protein n=1 Tax=Zarea fungicola TaxID=93591 RepID=A0ACC1NMC9_9HYPO|nr:hypothetical protein NQ176_g2761 [Lecanicillium fungicola]
MQLFRNRPGPKQGNYSDVVFREGYWKHGRLYGSWRPGLYPFPIDEEEKRRLDIFHKFFLLARRNCAFSYPIRDSLPTSILDLGTGTGIWAIYVAEEILPEAHITAVDLNRVQPACIRGSLWEAVYKNAFEHTVCKSGIIQQVEIDWVPLWENTAPESSALREWSRLFLKGMDGFQRSVRVSSSNVRRMMETAGYVEFDETIIRCCVSPWCDDPHEKLVAKWFNVGLTEAIEAMSLAPLVENLGMDVSQVKELCERLRSEICKLRYHAYFNM